MKTAVFGSGSLGLVTAGCLAEAGHEVICVDKAVERIAMLRSGMIPEFEPGLDDLIERHRASGRLRFTTEVEAAVVGAETLILAGALPLNDEGLPDLRPLWSLAQVIAGAMIQPRTIVVSMAVPVGTCRDLARLIASQTRIPFEIAALPSFLREGTAIADFPAPERLIVGARTAEAAGRIRGLYGPLLAEGRPLLVMSPESAELARAAAGVLEAARISLLNEVAGIAGAVGATIDDLTLGLGLGGPVAGPGYGGPELPRDVRGLSLLAAEAGLAARVLPAIDAANEAQKRQIGGRILGHFDGNAPGRTVALWGLAARSQSDETRESPSLVLIGQLLAAGVIVRVADPQAMDRVRSIYGDALSYCTDPYDAARGAHALAVMTDWPEYARPDLRRLGQVMAERAIFDGRNLLDPGFAAFHGFLYHGIGRPTRQPESVTELRGPHFAPAWSDAAVLSVA